MPAIAAEHPRYYTVHWLILINLFMYGISLQSSDN